MHNNHYLISIGDPTIIGWIITIAYFIAAYLCWCIVKFQREITPDKQDFKGYSLWFGLFVLLLLLGLNKQLDFQILLTDIGRYLAKKEGLYGERREIQKAFIWVVGLVGSLGLIGLLVLLKDKLKEFRLVVIGLLLLIAFVLIRAASFNHVDYFLDNWRMLGPFRMKYIVELGGIMLIGADAIMTLRAGKR